MTPDEVRMLDNRYALLFIRGERPVLDEKYDIMPPPLSFAKTVAVPSVIINTTATYNAIPHFALRLMRDLRISFLFWLRKS